MSYYNIFKIPSGDLINYLNIFPRKRFFLFFISYRPPRPVLLKILVTTTAPYPLRSDRMVKLGFQTKAGS